MMNKTTSRLLAISDIHGHTEGLLTLLDHAHYRTGKDRLIMLGDYINEEPNSWDALITIKSLSDQGAVALSGNVDLYISSVQAIPDHIAPFVQWLEYLPSYWIEDNYLFVHAGVRPHVQLELQTRDDLTQIREQFWHEETGLPYTILFGHTPTFKLGGVPGQLWYGNNRIGIDTGAKHGHRLSLLDLSENVLYSCSTAPENLYGDIRSESCTLPTIKK